MLDPTLNVIIDERKLSQENAEAAYVRENITEYDHSSSGHVFKNYILSSEVFHLEVPRRY